jgi:hypothetical protein
LWSGLDDLGDLAGDLHHDVDVAEVRITAARPAAFVFPGMTDKRDMDVELFVDHSQMRRGAVLILGLVFVAAVRGDALRVGIENDQADVAAEGHLGGADRRDDQIHAIRVEQVDDLPGDRDRQPFQPVAHPIRLQPSLIKVSTFEREDDNVQAAFCFVASPVAVRKGIAGWVLQCRLAGAWRRNPG